MSQTIIRAPRRNRFVILDQQAVEDTRLSWAARGLLAYLLSRPDDWRVLINDLRKRGDLQRDGIYKLLRELRDTGYVRFQRARDAQGRIRGGTYLVQEIPTTPHPDPVKPEALPKTDRYLIPTTTKGDGRCSEMKIEFADWIPKELIGSAIDKVSRLEPSTAQLVIDEWAGIMADDRIKSSPLGYLHTLVSRVESGEFRLFYADGVVQIREQENGT